MIHVVCLYQLLQNEWVGKNKEKAIFFSKIKFCPGRADSSITDVQISNLKRNLNHMPKSFERQNHMKHYYISSKIFLNKWFFFKKSNLVFHNDGIKDSPWGINSSIKNSKSQSWTLTFNSKILKMNNGTVYLTNDEQYNEEQMGKW